MVPEVCAFLCLSYQPWPGSLELDLENTVKFTRATFWGRKGRRFVLRHRRATIEDPNTEEFVSYSRGCDVIRSFRSILDDRDDFL